MAVELVSYVLDHPCEISPVESRDVEPSCPPNRSGHAAIGAHGGDTLHQTHEIAQTRVRPKAHDKVDVIGEDRSTEHMHRRSAAGARHSAFHICDGGLVDTTYPLPSVPGDVRVELISSMARH